MFYTRGSSDDYDRFAKVTGDPGWSWDSIQPYIRKVPICLKPALFQPADLAHVEIRMRDGRILRINMTRVVNLIRRTTALRERPSLVCLGLLRRLMIW